MLIVLSLLMLAPVVLVISTSFKTPQDAASNPFALFSSFTLGNYREAWVGAQYDEYMRNSVLLTVPSLLLVLVLSTLGGYAFARLPFPGRTLCFYLVIMGLLVPFFTYMIPLYFELQSFGLIDKLPGVILVLATTMVAFGTFFMRAFFMDLPVELEQAARVDGASEWQIFRKIMLPLAAPGITAVSVFALIGIWNNFLVPFLYLPSGKFQPVTTALYQFIGAHTVSNGPLAAATLMAITPVLVVFLVLNRKVSEGFISSAVKG